MFLCTSSKMCINPKVRLGLALALGLGFMHISGAFKERRNNGEGLYLNCRQIHKLYGLEPSVHRWRSRTYVCLLFLAIMPYVWSEFLILMYHCNLQVRSCRLICDLRMLLVFIWLRCETALALKRTTKSPSSVSFPIPGGTSLTIALCCKFQCSVFWTAFLIAVRVVMWLVNMFWKWLNTLHEKTVVRSNSLSPTLLINWFTLILCMSE